MKPITVSRHIKASIDRVEAIFTDLKHAANHIGSITRIEMQSEEPFGVGTRWRETRVMFGREATEEMEITEYVPKQFYAAEAESCGTRYRRVFRFASSGDSTDVQVEFAATPISFLAKLLAPLSGVIMRGVVKCLENDLSDLAGHAESAAEHPV